MDYFIELNNVEEKIDTLQLKKIFHKSLQKAKTGSVMEEEENIEPFDPDVMLGDQPDEDRMKKSNEKMTKNIDKSAGKLEMGKFVMDPAYTEFIGKLYNFFLFVFHIHLFFSIFYLIAS